MSLQVNQRRVYFMLSVFLVASLTSFGCAHKPKEGENAGSGQANGAMAPNIQDKSLSSDDIGSDSGKIDGLSSVHFAFDSASLNSEAKALLRKNVDWVNKHSGIKLQIEGHCDRHGSVEYNLALGERRAKMVKKYLVDLGIDEARVSIISYGNEKLIDNGETDQADQANRRANFKPIGAGVSLSNAQR